MSRPKYKDKEKTAKQRLEDAFWELLSEIDYGHITVKELSNRAKVNPNTFYYYYSTMDDLAIAIFEENKLVEIPDLVHESIKNGSDIDLKKAVKELQLNEKWKKLRYFARDDSAFLRRYFTTAIKEYWLKMIGIDENELRIEDRLDLEFIFCGITMVIGNHQDDEGLELLSDLQGRELGQGIMKTFQRLVLNEGAFGK